ncbi:inositol monophosphatase family protein [Halomarina litorea]|uniref:inositol monophosphatase family protein n=1 Tax=Halomarina litorea TaxID=2961595 RepID=UPI0020C51A0C|nr:inositol monophosphatase family protein [Halomarina sp. BCD28]
MSGGLTVPDGAIAVARDAVRAAGDELEPLHAALADGRAESPGAVASEAADAAEQRLLEHLDDRLPAHAVRTREDVVRAGGRGTDGPRYEWHLDPLDGADGFAAGTDGYAVSAALYDRETPVLGVVYHPPTAALYRGTDDDGAYRNGDPLSGPTTERLADAAVVAGYDRGGSFLRGLADEVGERRRCSSAALNLCRLAAGEVDAVWEFDTYPWDVAAGVVVARGAGATVTDEHGERFDPGTEPEGGRPMLAAGPLHGDLLAHAWAATPSSDDRRRTRGPRSGGRP